MSKFSTSQKKFVVGALTFTSSNTVSLFYVLASYRVQRETKRVEKKPQEFSSPKSMRERDTAKKR